MTEPNLHDELLHRLADGDLDAEEDARVRKALEGDSEAQKTLRELEKLSVLMHTAGESWQAQADPEAMFAQIEAKLAQEVGHNANHKAGQAATTGDAPTPAKSGGSLWHMLFGDRHWIPTLGALAMTTAVVLLTVYRPVDPEDLAAGPGPAPDSDTAPSEEGLVAPQGGAAPGHVQAKDDGTDTPPPKSEAAAAAAKTASSEVVQVDFGNNAGTVFDVALSDGSSTAVIWINDGE